MQTGCRRHLKDGYTEGPAQRVGHFGAADSGDTQLASQPGGIKWGAVKSAPLNFKRWHPPLSSINAHDELGSLGNIFDVDLFNIQALPLQKLLGAPAVRAPASCVHPDFSAHSSPGLT